MLELKDQLLKVDGYSLDEVWALLWRLDYMPFDIEDGRFTAIEKAQGWQAYLFGTRAKNPCLRISR
jgi:hypothetical protein